MVMLGYIVPNYNSSVNFFFNLENPVNASAINLLAAQLGIKQIQKNIIYTLKLK